MERFKNCVDILLLIFIYPSIHSSVTLPTCSFCLLAFSGAEATSSGCLSSQLASWVSDCTI